MRDDSSSATMGSSRIVVHSLAPGDARIGWMSVRDARAISRACDLWLESRGVYSWKKNRKKN